MARSPVAGWFEHQGIEASVLQYSVMAVTLSWSVFHSGELVMSRSDIILAMSPQTLSGGKRIWADDGEARAFELSSAKTANTGVQVCHYLRAR